MSTNFFAALDDSGDEAPAKSAPAKKEAVVAKKPAAAPKKTVAEPSKVDARKKPNTNDRNTKFGRGGRGPVRDGKRQYDRRSGTGRGKEIKKDGGGARNWGSDKNEARRAEGHVDDPNTAEEAPAPTEEGEEAPPAEGGEEEPVPEPEPEPEPEDNTMSYEEYLAAKANADNPLLAPKQEREVTNEFAGLAVKAKPKDEEEEFFSKGGTKQKKGKKNKDSGKKGTVVTPEFRIASTTRSDDRRGDGGGRGRDGGGRGRDGGRGRGDGRGRGRDGGRGRGDGRGRGRDGGRAGRGGGRGRGGTDINVLDPAAFPSL